MSQFSIVGARFSVEEFGQYVSQVEFARWKPSLLVIHNTAHPSLEMRPNGFRAEHLLNLRDYYSGLGWSAGPHLFIDDHAIWVFTPLNRRGVHSPSYNSNSIGIELLGNYDVERTDSGRGMRVVELAAKATAILLDRLSLQTSDIRFHKEDSKTTHKSCPGRHLKKAEFVQLVSEELNTSALPELLIFEPGCGHEPVARLPLQLESGIALINPRLIEPYVDLRFEGGPLVSVRTALEPEFRVSWDAPKRRAIAVRKVKPARSQV